MDKVLDYFGQELKVGDGCIRPEKWGNTPEFGTCEVVSFDTTRKYGDVVEVLGFNYYTGVRNLKTGWTYPRRLLKHINKDAS